MPPPVTYLKGGLVAALADTASVTPTVDTFDGGRLSSLSQSTTINNPTGTPQFFQRYVLLVTSSVQRTLTWGSQYRGLVGGLPPVTTGGGVTDWFEFIWNAADSKWDLIGSSLFAFADLADVALSGITDGQLPAWSATLSKFIPVSPTGDTEGGYSPNTTGTTTDVTGNNGSFATAVAIGSTDISVTDSGGRPVWVHGMVMDGRQTTTGDGVAAIDLYETTGGSGVFVCRLARKRLPNSVAAQLQTFDLKGAWRLGTVTTTRTFNLRTTCFGASASPVWKAQNSAGGPSWLKWVME